MRQSKDGPSGFGSGRAALLDRVVSVVPRQLAYCTCATMHMLVEVM